MYLMFEGLGRVSDRELMMVNLDLLDCYDAQHFPPPLNCVLYNPTEETRSVTLTVPSAHGAPVHWSENGHPVRETLNISGKATLRLVAEF